MAPQSNLHLLRSALPEFGTAFNIREEESGKMDCGI